MYNWTRSLPVSEANVIATNGTGVAEDCEEKGDQHADDLPKSQPEFHFTVYNNTEKRETLIKGPSHQNPGVAWDFVGPVTHDDADEIVFGCDVGGPLRVWSAMIP